MKALLIVLFASLFLVGCGKKTVPLNIQVECTNGTKIWMNGEYSVTHTPYFGCVWYKDEKNGNDILINVVTQDGNSILENSSSFHSINPEYFLALKIAENSVKTILVHKEEVTPK